MNLVQISAAFLAGMAGALGLGGGGVLLLYLTLWASFPQVEAQGINLIFFIPCAALSLFFHGRKGLVDWRTSFKMALGGIFGVAGGVLLSQVIETHLLSKIFAGGVILLGLREVLQRKQANKAE